MSDPEQMIIRFLINSANLDENEIVSDSEIVGSGIFSSLTMMELVMAVENRFEIEIPPKDLTEEIFSTVRSLAQYITERVQPDALANAV
jgi:acyl carrier protein